MKNLRILVLVFAIGLSSCSFFGDDEQVRTLPHSSSFDLVSINELNRTVELPGSYNVRGYVVSVRDCPEKVLCILADGIMVYEYDDASPSDEELKLDGIFLATEDPGQFKIGRRYEISVTIDHDRIPTASWPFAIIIGYDLMPG